MEHGASGEQRAPLPTDRARGSGGDAWIPILDGRNRNWTLTHGRRCPLVGYLARNHSGRPARRLSDQNLPRSSGGRRT